MVSESESSHVHRAHLDTFNHLPLNWDKQKFPTFITFGTQGENVTIILSNNLTTFLIGPSVELLY